MRTLIALPLLAFALVACKVTKNEDNGTITAEYNQDIAENAASDAGNFAGQVANDVEESAEKVGNKAENVDIDVDTNTAN